MNLGVSLVLFCFVWSISAQTNCGGSPNTLPIFEDPPVFIKEVPNGKLYHAGNVEPPLFVVKLYGTPYEMGLAHGQLLKDEINQLYPQAMKWAEEQIDQFIQFLPSELREIIERFGIEAGLEATYYLTRDHFGAHWNEELQGLADGADLSFMEVMRWHLFPELIQASCSIVGAWGPATSNTTGSMYQLRALDWAVNGPFQQWPAFIVYHPTASPTTPAGHPFSILSWAGVVFGLTGYSQSPVGVCEKVWIHYNGTYARRGYPWEFLLRDILQFDNNVDDALSRIINAPRTCSIFVGLGDGKEFRAVEYSYDRVEVYSDHNFPVYPSHPQFDGLVYIDKHTQPSSNPCMGSLMDRYYGKIDALTLLRNVAPVEQTGNTHVAVYDYLHNFVYVSNASPYSPSGGSTPAYDRPFIRLNMTDLFV